MHSSTEDPCENAQHHSCICSDCMNALHKWKGLMDSVSDAEARAAWARLHLGAWSKRLQMDQRQTRKVLSTEETIQRQSRPTQRALKANAGAISVRSKSRNSNVNKVAASDFVMVGIVDALASQPSGSAVSNARYILDSVEAIARTMKGLIPNRKVRAGVANSHLWCGVLAETVKDIESRHSADPFRASFDRYFRSAAGLTMDDIVRENLTKQLAPVLDNKLSTSMHPDLATSIRIAASFICAAPEGHPEVKEACLIPLAKDFLSGQDFVFPIEILDLD